MSLAALIRRMTDAGATPECIAIAVEAIEAGENREAAKRADRAAARQRQRQLEKAAREAAERDMAATVARHGCDKDTTVATSDRDMVATAPPEVSPKDNISNPHPTPPSSLRSVSDRAKAVDPVFERFWQVYPKREGSNPKEPAARKFKTFVAGGVDPEAIIGGAEAYARSVVGTEPRFIAQAVTWLGQMRWRDEHHPPSPQARAGPARPATNGFHALLSRIDNAQQPHDSQGFSGSGDSDGRPLTIEGELFEPR